jgi:hypothetical protein
VLLYWAQWNARGEQGDELVINLWSSRRGIGERSCVVLQVLTSPSHDVFIWTLCGKSLIRHLKLHPCPKWARCKLHTSVPWFLNKFRSRPQDLGAISCKDYKPFSNHNIVRLILPSTTTDHETRTHISSHGNNKLHILNIAGLSLIVATGTNCTQHRKRTRPMFHGISLLENKFRLSVHLWTCTRTVEIST